MLATDQRSLFLEALYPPEGYAFDRGIGTTFTADLMALLMAPLALSYRDAPDAEALIRDPVLFLESLNRFAERLTLFCQAGHIAVPRQDSLLNRFLEPMLIEVQAPRGGVFHPKVWVLRYTSSDRPTLYRVLNLSRNLTFDRSWDLMLRLEGEVQQRTYGYGRNRPLGDFLTVLPKLAVHAVDARIQHDIDLLEHEVRRVAFGIPVEFQQDTLEFCPSGISGYPRGYRIPKAVNRALVISPFLGEGLLSQIAAQGTDNVLVSRLDSLESLSSQVASLYRDCFVLDDADVGIVDEEGPDSSAKAVAGAERAAVLSGLHAKLFLFENGWDVTWLQGSANATSPAFDGQNVEFMVAVKGRRSQVGIDKVLGADDDQQALRALLRHYEMPGAAAPPVDPAELAVERLADEARRRLIEADLQLRVEGEYAMVLQGTLRRVSPGGSVDVHCWPISLPESRAERLPPAGTASVRFGSLSSQALTPFIAFRIEAREPGGLTHGLRFVLKLPLAGLPEDRTSRLIGAIISDREQFLRFLWLILADDRLGLPDFLQVVGDGQRGREWRHSLGEMPLLESLLRALSRSPDKIDRIAELVERLQHTPEGQAVLPEGFDGLWGAVLQIRRSQK